MKDWRSTMKKRNKLMAAAFAFILGVSTVMPGMQAQAGVMARFPAQNTSTYTKAYTAGLQTFLLNYSKETKDIIRDNGMVDGSYGTATERAVRVYQTKRNLADKDGMCGPQTWTSIQSYLFSCSSWKDNGWVNYRLNATYYNSGKSLRRKTSNSIWNAWYGQPSDTDGSTVMWHYVG